MTTNVVTKHKNMAGIHGYQRQTTNSGAQNFQREKNILSSVIVAILVLEQYDFVLK